jgi:hypothetical protein
MVRGWGGRGYGHGRTLNRNAAATTSAQRPVNSTEGRIDPASTDECATIVPLKATAEGLADAEALADTDGTTAGAVTPADACVGAAAVGAGAPTWPGVTVEGCAAGADCVGAAAADDAGGGALTDGSSPPSSVGTLPVWFATAVAARSVKPT